MGRKLDALFGRKFKPTKLKTTVKLAVSRLTVLKNKRQALLTVARSNIVQLLNQNHHEHALHRVDQVIKEQNMLDVFVMLDDYCHVLLQMVNLIEKQWGCPDELKEAVSSLLFAAPRCGEFPELQEIRAILTARYGKEFAHGAIELRNNCGVNRLVIQKLSQRQSGLETRMKTLQEIAMENDIVLKLEDSFPVVKEESKSMNGVIEKKSSALSDDFDEVMSYSESIKGKKRYKDVEDAAEAAYEAAAYAAVAARVAVELSRPRSFGSDNPDGPFSRSRKVRETHPDGPKHQVKYDKNEEIEYDTGHEDEGERSNDGSYSDGYKEKTLVFDESDNEIDNINSELGFKKGFRMPYEVHQLNLTKMPISMRTKLVYGH